MPAIAARTCGSTSDGKLFNGECAPPAPASRVVRARVLASRLQAGDVPDHPIGARSAIADPPVSLAARTREEAHEATTAGSRDGSRVAGRARQRGAGRESRWHPQSLSLRQPGIDVDP